MKVNAYQFTRQYIILAKDEEEAQELFEDEFEKWGFDLIGDPEDWVNDGRKMRPQYDNLYRCGICNEMMTEAEELAYGGWCANCKGQKERGEA